MNENPIPNTVLSFMAEFQMLHENLSHCHWSHVNINVISATPLQDQLCSQTLQTALEWNLGKSFISFISISLITLHSKQMQKNICSMKKFYQILYFPNSEPIFQTFC